MKKEVQSVQHGPWFNVGSSAQECAHCGMQVTDREILDFARAHGVDAFRVAPGTVLAKKLGAPWG